MAEIRPISVTGEETLSGCDHCDPDRAVDRDLSTPAVMSASNGASWLKFEFGEPYHIKEIIIYHRFYTNWYISAQHCAKSEEIFRSCMDGQTNVDVSVYQGDKKQKSCGTLQLTHGLEQSDQIYTLLCDAYGDTVILSKSSGQIYVFEVVVNRRCKYCTGID